MKTLLAVTAIAVLAACGGSVSAWELRTVTGRVVEVSLDRATMTVDGAALPTTTSDDVISATVPNRSDYYTVTFTTKESPASGFFCTHTAYPTETGGIAFNVACELFSADER